MDEINSVDIDPKVSDANKLIQAIKQDIVSKINTSLKIDSRDMKEVEKVYLETLELLEGEKLKVDIEKVSTDIKTSIEHISKKQTANYLGNNMGYIGNFDTFIVDISKYIFLPINELKDKLNDKFISKNEKNNIKLYLSIIQKNNILDTRSKELDFDEKVFQEQLEEHGSLNSKCFFELDFNGNKNYFSLNELLNDVETFGIEFGLPTISTKNIPENIRKKYFPSLNRKIKYTLFKNIIGDLRDKQEVLLFNFKDYDVLSGFKNGEKEGFIAEKVVEWKFRKIAMESGLDISIEKASIGEDQEHKVDLLIIIKDEKRGINIKKELQITLRDDIKVKEKQVNKRRRQLQKENNFTDIELVQLTLKDLNKKLKIWKYYNRPIGKLDKLLDEPENDLLLETFKRLVTIEE